MSQFQPVFVDDDTNGHSADHNHQSNHDEPNGNLAVPCPFGTYLDLHFVEFCNQLSWSRRVPDSIRKFRQAAANRKKKWRKSMDQMLYTEMASSTDKELTTEVESSSEETASNHEVARENGHEGSPLHEALGHFDEALKSHFSGRQKLEVCREEDEEVKCTFLLPEKQEVRESLFSVPEARIPKRSSARWNGEMSDEAARNGPTQENSVDRTDSQSSSSPSSTVNRTVPAEALESIREKLAAGLRQMSILQAQVDAIPDLQHQISTLQGELFLRDEQASMTSSCDTSSASDAAVAFMQLYAPELVEQYSKWIGTEVENRGGCCDQSTQFGEVREKVDAGISTVKKELVSFGINTDVLEVPVEVPTVRGETKENGRRKSVLKNKAKKNGLFRRRKQQVACAVSDVEQTDDQLAVVDPQSSDEISALPVMRELPETENTSDSSAELVNVTQRDESETAPSPPADNLSESLPESGLALSQQMSDAAPVSSDPSSLSPSHSDEANSSCCSEEVDEGSYDLQNGHLSDKCFDEKDDTSKHVYTNYICRQSLNKEMLAACKVFNDSIQRDGISKSKKSARNVSSLAIIHREWFPTAGKSFIDAHLISDYLDAFEEISKMLLQAVVNLTDDNGNTLLHYALSQNNFDVVSLLLDSKVCNVDIVNRAGYTSVMLASLAELQNPSQYAIAGRLFRLGDINRKAHQHGQTALMLAVSHGRLDTVRMLLEVGADVNIQDNDGSTALMCASEHGHIEIVKLLLEQPEIDTSLIDQDGMAALYVALEAGNKDIAALIYASTSASTKLSTMSISMSEKVSTGDTRRSGGMSLKGKTATM